MACRKFTEGSKVLCKIGACGVTGAVSFAALVKLDGTVKHVKEEVPIEEFNEETEEWEIIGYETIEREEAPGLERGSMVSALDSAKTNPGSFYDFQVEGGKLEIFRSGASREIEVKPYGDIWALFFGTKTGGEAKAKLYAYRFDTKTLVGPVEGVGAIKDAAANVGGFINLGQWGSGEQLRGLGAALAVWSKVLTKTEIEELTAATYLEQWLTKTPVGYWDFRQTSLAEKVLDQTGNGADQIELAGTELSAEKPPIPYTKAEAEEGKGGGGSSGTNGRALSRCCNPIVNP